MVTEHDDHGISFSCTLSAMLPPSQHLHHRTNPPTDSTNVMNTQLLLPSNCISSRTNGTLGI